MNWIYEDLAIYACTASATSPNQPFGQASKSYSDYNHFGRGHSSNHNHFGRGHSSNHNHFGRGHSSNKSLVVTAMTEMAFELLSQMTIMVIAIMALPKASVGASVTLVLAVYK